MRARSWGILLCGLALGSGGTVLMQRLLGARASASSPAPEPREACAPDDGARTREAGSAATRVDTDLRAAVRVRVAAALAEQRRGYELELYLQELERAARKQGFVSALEVAPGLAAIEAAYPNDQERGPAFARRMEALGKELGQSTQGPEDPPPGVTAASLLQVIRTTPAGPVRDKLVRQALTAIAQLPATEQEPAGRALDSATAGPSASPPRSPDAVLAAIATTGDAEHRRQLVQEFIGTASKLPMEEQERRFRELDRATAITPGPGSIQPEPR